MGTREESGLGRSRAKEGIESIFMVQRDREAVSHRVKACAMGNSDRARP